MDMSVIIDYNKSVKEYNRISKYENLEMKTAQIWYLHITTGSVIVRAHGMMKKEVDKDINKTPGSPASIKYKRNILCGTAHHFRRVQIMWLKILPRWGIKNIVFI